MKVRIHHHRAAALSHLRADGELPDLPDDWRAQPADCQPARHSEFHQGWGKYPVTVVTGVNTLFNALLNHPDFAKLDFSTMNVTLGGGMAVQGRWPKSG